MKSLIDPVVALAEEAGRAILEVYSSDFEVQSKEDDSPLTQADLASHHCIVRGLEALTPGVPIISEESGLPEYEVRSQWGRYWLIDPLDGTKEFVNRNGEFTVNIALIDNLLLYLPQARSRPVSSAAARIAVPALTPTLKIWVNTT